MRTRAAVAALAVLLPACSGPPIHVSRPPAAPRPAEQEPEPARTTRGAPDIVVRVGLHWDGDPIAFGTDGATVVPMADGGSTRLARGARFSAVASGGETFRVLDGAGSPIWEGDGPVRIDPPAGAMLRVADRVVRGRLEISARADSLFVVNVLPLEEYLRGVVPKEIGMRPAEDVEAVAAQAVAARTYTAKRLSQYNSLPFDVFADVQDQEYAGVQGENAIADEAVRKTRGVVLADGQGLIEAYYSSTCGGERSDIASVWPHRQAHDALRGGADGPPGHEWCRSSQHFRWTERWKGSTLSAYVRDYLPGVLELPPGSVRGELVGLEVLERGPSGRIAMMEYRTTNGRWRVPGDKNRWVLRREDGTILRSALVEFTVHRKGGRVVEVIAEGRGNGHGVGMCQVGALGRAEAGQSFREILRSYYPGVEVRELRLEDLPPGRSEGA